MTLAGWGGPTEQWDRSLEWISGATAAITWQHHLLSVYHVDIDGDQASALSYLTSHQVFDGEPNVAKTLVASIGSRWRLDAL